MTENNKHEWFEVAENDGPAMPPKPFKTLPILPLHKLLTSGLGGKDYKGGDD